MVRVADYIVDRVHQAGVTHLFMVTGRGILFLSDAVARHEEIEGISVHHEQAGAFAAMAYAQSKGSPGVCMVSTGCGSTNAITGLLCAWQDDVPCVFISGQNKLAETTRYTGIPLRTYGQQEADIVSVVEPLTKYAVMLTDHRAVARELDKALYLATHGRKGPVWIDVPLDIQNMRVEPDELERWYPDDTRAAAPGRQDLQEIADALGRAERPVVLIGSGVRSAGAVDLLAEFAEKAGIPVVFAPSAADIYGATNRLSIGAVGSLGATRAGNFTLQNSDLLLVIGHRLSTVTTGEDYAKFAREAQVIVADIDPIEHSKNTVRIDRFIEIDAALFLKGLLQTEITPAPVSWVEKCLHWKSVFPKCDPKYRESELVDMHFLGECLTEVLPEDAAVITDAGLEELIIPSTVSFKSGQRCIHPASQGSMGYALPAAIGVSYSGRAQVFPVIGDGSVMMNLQELQTISHHRLPVKIIIVNNNVYSVIRRRQVELFRTRTIGTDPENGVSCPDFSKVAAAFDIPYLCIENSAGLEQGLRKLTASSGPVLCEIMAVENQEYLANSYAHDAKRRVVRRPLEDQFPFMDRELFLSEMVIDPIDQ